MMCEAGLRRGEMLGLEWGDIHLASNIVMVGRRVYEMRGSVRDVDTPKSGKPRPVGISESLAWDLRFMKERLDYPEGSEPVWTRQSHYTGGKREPITGSSLVKVIQRVGASSGVTTKDDQWITPHVLRASGATIAALQGTNPYLIQQQLEHANLETTQKYLRPDRREALEGYGECFG